MIYTVNNCIRAFGYTNFDKLIADMGSVDNLKAYVIANGYADIAVAEDTELLLVDVNGKTWHTGCYGAVIEPEVEPDYLCFTSTGDSTVGMTQEGTPNTSAGKVIQYKLNNGQWQNWNLSTITLADGDKMYLKSDDIIPITETSSIYKQFTMTGSIAASGNIMSLLNFTDTLTTNAFCRLFYNCSSLTQAPELPATTLANFCYFGMFQGCTSLVNAPTILPATTLAEGCYRNMFFGCAALLATPALPATTLADFCYNQMFSGCASLTTAPTILPATQLTPNCYSRMFSRCASITTAPELPALELVTNCYSGMFIGCSKLNYVKAMFTTNPSDDAYINIWLDGVSPTGTFVKNSAATWTNEQAGIPTGWTVQVEGGVTPDPEPGPGPTPEPDKDYLCFTSASNGGAVTMIQNGTPDTSGGKVIQYKLNDGQWQTWDLSGVMLNDGDKMYLKSDDIIPLSESDVTYKNFEIMGTITASGNIMSLLNFSNTVTSYGFYKLFALCTITSSPKLPATTLAPHCYESMFFNCPSLTAAPELPATTLEISCYQSMFDGCMSLTQAPELPATTLDESCYNSMFKTCAITQAPELPTITLAPWCYSAMFAECSLLTAAPALPATALADYCYSNMFTSCTSLTTAPTSLPATTLADFCYTSMFSGCTSLTTAPALPATTLATTCYQSMFSGCTSLTAAPELHATRLTPRCYSSMFYNCTSLTQAPELPSTILATSCYEGMFTSCTSLTTAPSLPADVLWESCYKSMFSDCTSLTQAPELHATSLDPSCYSYMFKGCTSLVQAPALPATTLESSCYIGMFKGCTSLTSAPELPATTLVKSCYNYMFRDCTNLNYVKALFIDIPKSSLTSWLSGVSSTGTFVKNSSATWTNTQAGIPTGWTVQTASPDK